MDVEAAQVFFSLLALVAGGGAVALAVARIAAASSSSAARLVAALDDAALWIAFLVAATAMAGSLYFSEVADFIPCTLCWYQRIAMYPLAVILLVAAIRRDRGVRWYAGPIAAAGAVISTYHYLVEWFPSLEGSGVCAAVGPVYRAVVPPARLRQPLVHGALRFCRHPRPGRPQPPDPPPGGRVTQRSTVSMRTPRIIAVVVVVVAIAGLVAVLVTRGGGDDKAGNDITYGTVHVDGAPLPAGEGELDQSIGSTVPTISGTDYAGKPMTIAPGKDGPLMIVVMAHWCPHCNNEIPKLIEWKKSGNVPDGLRVVGISTAAVAGTPHFPPGEWLRALGWDWPVIADDPDQTAAVAVGTTGYPFIMFVDADGKLISRTSGEMPIEEVQQWADETAATGS